MLWKPDGKKFRVGLPVTVTLAYPSRLTAGKNVYPNGFAIARRNNNNPER